MEEEQKVEFLEDNDPLLNGSLKTVEKARGAIIAWLMKIGLVRTEKAANKIMVSVALLGFVITFYILFKFVF